MESELKSLLDQWKPRRFNDHEIDILKQIYEKLGKMQSDTQKIKEELKLHKVRKMAQTTPDTVDLLTVTRDLQVSVALGKGDTQEGSMTEDELNLPLPNMAKHLESKTAKTVYAMTTSHALHPQARVHGTSPTSTIILTMPSDPPQPPDPPNPNQSNLVSANVAVKVGVEKQEELVVDEKLTLPLEIIVEQLVDGKNQETHDRIVSKTTETASDGQRPRVKDRNYKFRKRRVWREYRFSLATKYKGYVESPTVLLGVGTNGMKRLYDRLRIMKEPSVSSSSSKDCGYTSTGYYKLDHVTSNRIKRFRALPNMALLPDFSVVSYGECGVKKMFSFGHEAEVALTHVKPQKKHIEESGTFGLEVPSCEYELSVLVATPRSGSEFMFLPDYVDVAVKSPLLNIEISQTRVIGMVQSRVVEIVAPEVQEYATPPTKRGKGVVSSLLEDMIVEKLILALGRAKHVWNPGVLISVKAQLFWIEGINIEKIVTQEYEKEKHGDSIVYVYVISLNPQSKSLVLNIVRKAGPQLIIDRSRIKEFLSSVRLVEFNKLSAKLILGDDGTAIRKNRLTIVECLSGTASLKVGAEFLSKHYHGRTSYINEPTWENFFLESCGKIRSLYTTRKSGDCVLISYYVIRTAHAAMRALQNKLLRKRTGDIHSSIPKENSSKKGMNQGTLQIFKMGTTVAHDEDELLKLFFVYDETREIKETPNRRFHRFIEYCDAREAETALKALSRSDRGGKCINLKLNRHGGSRQVSVPSTSPNWDITEVTNFFNQVASEVVNSPPARIECSWDPGGFCLGQAHWNFIGRVNSEAVKSVLVHLCVQAKTHGELIRLRLWTVRHQSYFMIEGAPYELENTLNMVNSLNFERRKMRPMGSANSLSLGIDRLHLLMQGAYGTLMHLSSEIQKLVIMSCLEVQRISLFKENRAEYRVKMNAGAVWTELTWMICRGDNKTVEATTVRQNSKTTQYGCLLLFLKRVESDFEIKKLLNSVELLDWRDLSVMSLICLVNELDKVYKIFSVALVDRTSNTASSKSITTIDSLTSSTWEKVKWLQSLINFEDKVVFNGGVLIDHG